MNPILIVKCKTNILSSIAMVVFGLALIGFGGWMISEGESLWWSIAVLFGIFCVYQWSMILYRGSMTIVLLVKDGILYTTYDRTKIVVDKLDEIKNFEFYTNTLAINAIQRFWRYMLKVNGANTSDILHFNYQDKKVDWIDLSMNEVKITDQQLEDIARFLLSHNPHIQIGKA